VSAVPLCVDLTCTSQDQLLSQGEEIGTVALGIFLSADVGVVAGAEANSTAVSSMRRSGTNSVFARCCRSWDLGGAFTSLS
jgi:hypothetical protein